MCENDQAVDAWFESLLKTSFIKYPTDFQPKTTIERQHWRMGHMGGVIRELAATVPGVREWLIEHMPGEG